MDFTIPSFLDPSRHHRDGEVVFLPLSLIEKRVLLNFDISDETGAAISMVPRAQNSMVATQVLVQQGEEALRAAGRSPELLEPNLESLAVLSGESPFREVPGAEAPDAVGQAEIIVSDAVARGFIQELSANFILLAPLRAKPGDRRIVKFAYDAAFGPLRRETEPGSAIQAISSWLRARAEALLEILGLRAFRTAFPLPAITDARSFHVELVFPDELVAEAEIVEFDDEEVVASLSQQRGAGRVHLYGGEMSGDIDWAAVLVQFRLRAGVVAPVFLLSALMTLALGAGLLAHSIWKVSTGGDAIAALVIALPSFFAPIAAPGEHRLTRRMFKGLRASVYLTATVSFLAASTLAVDIPESSPLDTLEIWRVLTVISVAISVLIGLVIARAPRGP